MKNMDGKGGGKRDEMTGGKSPNVDLGLPKTDGYPPMWSDAECKRVMDGGTPMSEMKKGGKSKMGGM